MADEHNLPAATHTAEHPFNTTNDDYVNLSFAPYADNRVKSLRFYALNADFRYFVLIDDITSTTEPDTDGDGIVDVLDACPQDPENDADTDGICAQEDNCPTVSNGDQANADRDGIGDLCDPDDDDDGVKTTLTTARWSPIRARPIRMVTAWGMYAILMMTPTACPTARTAARRMSTPAKPTRTGMGARTSPR